MKRALTSLAVLAIIALIATALLLGCTLPMALLAVVLLLLPLTATLTRPWAVVSPARSDTLERSLVLLRAPPAASIDR